jgi:hypothetical protein
MPATAAKVNGSPAVEDRFPVDSFRDAATHLRRPFAANAVKFKVQSSFPKEDPKTGLIVAYMDARLVVDRLNLVCPHLWFDEYQQIDGKLMMCKLTVDGISRRDVGEGTGKGLYSDALKRAAVKFGIGVSLYAIPQVFLKIQDGHLKPVRTSKGPSVVMKDAGERRCRELYAQWLAQHGIEKFGRPLDHGDAEGAQGDYEAEATQHPDPAEDVAGPVVTDRPLTEDEQARIVQAFQYAGLGPAQMAMFLAACGLSDITELTVATAYDLRSRLDAHIAKQGGAS